MTVYNSNRNLTYSDGFLVNGATTRQDLFELKHVFPFDNDALHQPINSRSND